MAALRVQREDLQPVLSAHHGNEALVAALEKAAAPESLISVLGRYIQFNSAFGAGLANLAGEIAARQGLFQDPAEALHIAADRAAEVAADFFYAAVESFDPNPAQIRSQLGDHDGISGNSDDFAGVILDTRNDGKTAMEFFVNAAGTQYDASQDDAPDRVWRDRSVVGLEIRRHREHAAA